MRGGREGDGVTFCIWENSDNHMSALTRALFQPPKPMEPRGSVTYSLILSSQDTNTRSGNEHSSIKGASTRPSPPHPFLTSLIPTSKNHNHNPSSSLFNNKPGQQYEKPTPFYLSK